MEEEKERRSQVCVGGERREGIDGITNGSEEGFILPKVSKRCFLQFIRQLFLILTAQHVQFAELRFGDVLGPVPDARAAGGVLVGADAHGGAGPGRAPRTAVDGRALLADLARAEPVKKSIKKCIISEKGSFSSSFRSLVLT